MPIPATNNRPCAPKPADDSTSLLPVWRRIHQAMLLRLSSHGLPFTVASALLCLHTSSDDAEPARLADQLLLPRQTMTFVLDALERAKLAHRKPHPVDRRRKIVVLTPKGVQKARTILADLRRYESDASQATFSPQGARAFRDSVTQLADVLERLNQPEPHR